ncbi:hypothetical protein JCM6882_004855 [Rhodosporidiobolus microsporus]
MRFSIITTITAFASIAAAQSATELLGGGNDGLDESASGPYVEDDAGASATDMHGDDYGIVSGGPAATDGASATDMYGPDYGMGIGGPYATGDPYTDPDVISYLATARNEDGVLVTEASPIATASGAEVTTLGDGNASGALSSASGLVGTETSSAATGEAASTSAVAAIGGDSSSSPTSASRTATGSAPSASASENPDNAANPLSLSPLSGFLTAVTVGGLVVFA